MAAHYIDVMMVRMASQITSLMTIYSTVYSGVDQRKHQSSTSLAFVWGIHCWSVNFLHKLPVTRKMFPFDDIIMHFPDDIFKWIFLNGIVWILIKIALKFGPRGPISNIQALVQIMAWCWPRNKPLSEPMMVSLMMHICITQPQIVEKNCVILDQTSLYSLTHAGNTVALLHHFSMKMVFCISGPLWGGSTGHQWFPSQRASNAELCVF